MVPGHPGQGGLLVLLTVVLEIKADPEPVPVQLHRMVDRTVLEQM